MDPTTSAFLNFSFSTLYLKDIYKFLPDVFKASISKFFLWPIEKCYIKFDSGH